MRNLTGATVNADLEYFDVFGTSQRTDSISLGPDEIHTVNIRDVSGLTADGDGFARGYVEVTTAGDPHQVPVLGGDFFQVDVTNNFATGDKLPRFTDRCTTGPSGTSFPFSGSGTRLAVWIANPRGPSGADPASFTVQPFDEGGSPTDPVSEIHTARHALEFQASDFAGASPFGFLRFDFTASGGGILYSEAQADGRFSVGMTGQCYEAP